MTVNSPATWIALGRDSLTLKPEPFQRFASGRASLKQAVLLVVAVGLIIGAVEALVGIPGLFRSSVVTSDQIINEFERVFEQMTPFIDNADPEFRQFMDIYRGSIEQIAPTIEQITRLPTPLPGFLSRILTWLGAWLSTPFALLASWLGISIWIMLFARLLGGRGALLPYLGASSLSTIPHLLAAFGFIPCLGGLLSLIGSIWGLVIQMRAVEITHGLSRERAILAVLLPYILLILLLLIGILFFILFITIAAGGN